MTQTQSRKSYVMFQNAGAADFHAIYLVGYTDKTNKADKIGMFGSGFKLALAAALRQGIDIVVFLDRDKITFRTTRRTVQGETVEQLIFVRQTPDGKIDQFETNLTLGYGAKDWKKAWVVFREILQNARDADPKGFEVVAGVEPRPREGTTRVFIEATDDVMDIYRNLDRYYREPQQAMLSCDQGRVYPKCSPEGWTWFYCKGMYVLAIPSAGMYDYDLYHMPINESRDASTGNLMPHLMRLLDSCPMELKIEILRHAISEGEQGHRTLENELFWSQSQRGFMWAQAFARAFPDHVLCSFSDIEFQGMLRTGRKAVRVQRELYRLLTAHGVQTADRILREEQEAQRTEFAPEGELKLNYDKAFALVSSKLPELHRLNVTFIKLPTNERAVAFVPVGRARGEYQFTETLLRSGPRLVARALVDALAQTKSLSGRCSPDFESHLIDMLIECVGV